MDKKQTPQLLSLRVIRLTRPSLDFSLPLTCEPYDLPFQAFKEAERNYGSFGASSDVNELGISNLLLLPQSFGNIYLGETFSCFMSLHNDSSQPVSEVSFKAELNTSSQNISLSGQTETSRETTLGVDENIDDVIHHEVKEIGNHFLVCKVSYAISTGEKRSFSKNFRFQVLKPLDVKTKFYNAEDYLSDEVYLEAQLQNLIAMPIFLEKVSLEPSPNFMVRGINSIDESNQLVFGSVNCLNFSDSRQYLFCLTPRLEVKENAKLLKGITTIGKLDIIWRTSMGERGRLQTSQLERMAPGYGDVRLTVEQIPSMVTLEKPFDVVIKVLNSCERAMDLKLSFDSKQSGGALLWEGVSGRLLGKIEAHANMDISLKAIPTRIGLQSISGLRLTDMFLHRTYDYDDIAQVFISPKNNERLE